MKRESLPLKVGDSLRIARPSAAGRPTGTTAGPGQGGFTLLEVIISLVVFAILGAMIAGFMSSSLTRSHEPVFLARDLATVQDAAEEAVAEYNRYLRGEINWAAFSGGLAACQDVTGQGNMSGAFTILECTFTVGDQRVNILFSEIN